MRRTPYSSPSYPATLENLGKLFSRSIPGPGMIAGAAMDITGVRPGYSGYQGQVSTPGFADPTNRALQANGPMGYGGAAAQMFNPIQQNAVLRGGMYQGGTNALKFAKMNGQVGGQMFMPQQPQQQAPAAPVQQFNQQWAPSQMFSTGGQFGGSVFRPGYSFLGQNA